MANHQYKYTFNSYKLLLNRRNPMSNGTILLELVLFFVICVFILHRRFHLANLLPVFLLKIGSNVVCSEFDSPRQIEVKETGHFETFTMTTKIVLLVWV